MTDRVGVATATQIVRANAGQLERVGTVLHSGGQYGQTQVSTNWVEEGDSVVLTIGINSTTLTVASITSPKTTQWVQVAAMVTDATMAEGLQIWVGVVNDIGSDVVKITWSADISTAIPEYDVYEFTAHLGPATKWFKDAWSSLDQTTPSTTITWSSLGAPSNPREICFGFAMAQNGCTPGATTGFTYDNGGYYAGIACYNARYTAAQTPTAVQSSSGRYLTSTLLLGADPGSVNTDTVATVTFDQVPTGIQWVTYQLAFEILTEQAIGDIVATTKLNGRTLNVSNVPGSNQGPPYYTIRPGDSLVVTFAGAPIGASCVVKMLYSEHPNGPAVSVAGVV